jgi:hypothetical protein
MLLSGAHGWTRIMDRVGFDVLQKKFHPCPPVVATVIRSGVHRTIGGESLQHSKGLLRQQKGTGTGTGQRRGHHMVDRVLSRTAGGARLPRRAAQRTITGGAGELHP